MNAVLKEIPAVEEASSIKIDSYPASRKNLCARHSR